MTDTTALGLTRVRLLKSARVLKAYFEQKLKINLELLTEPPKDPIDEGMQFDLTVSRFGIWGVRASAPLTEKVQSEISSSFHGLLGAMDNLETRLEDLILMQRRMEASFDELPSNVIPLHKQRYVTNSPGFSQIHDKRWILKLDCLIESLSTSDIHRMALELHSQSQRYAFLEYRDLDRTTRLNLSELLQLGAITLFVPSILDLTMEEQDTLKQVIQQDTTQRPLLMVGAQMAYADLRSTPTIHIEFLALLSRAYIKLSRPFAEYKDKGLIHYFLDSLAQNPS